MKSTINSGVSCCVCECAFNRDGMACTLDKIQVGNSCTGKESPCTCCDSFRQRG
ncbi:MAG: DUF1540 domain-containing protein [Clostridia bacterium]|nr:DUF1540 domain-containing protein [Clostridia bacterium]